jgi:hypothetical protein
MADETGQVVGMCEVFSEIYLSRRHREKEKRPVSFLFFFIFKKSFMEDALLTNKALSSVFSVAP